MFGSFWVSLEIVYKMELISPTHFHILPRDADIRSFGGPEGTLLEYSLVGLGRLLSG